LVVSGKINDLDKFILDLKKNTIKNIKLPVSAPFHCKLMQKARDIMKIEIEKINFSEPKNILISNVTGKEVSKSSEIKDLLIKQIESKVRWRESVKYMIDNGINQFIEIGPGKILSGLIKRIDRNVKVNAINNEEDISMVKIND
jgi:[acyl-carrier-protein] S-malonyltransferase